MSIAEDIAAIQAVNLTISGVVSAPDGTTREIPSQVEAADLPMVLAWPGAYEMESAARNVLDGTRVYQLAFLLAGESDGLGITESVTKVWEYLTKARTAWADYAVMGTTLNGGQVVAHYHDDGGERILLTYRNRTWVGFTARIEVWEPGL